jgi:chromosome segregation ATPase
MNETFMTPASPAGAMAKERTPEVVGAEVRNLTSAAKYLTVWYAIEIGRRLTEAKELVAHGEWMDWLKNETEFSQSAANRLMRIYVEYGQKMGLGIAPDGNSSTLINMSVSNALKLLTVQEEEREEFALEVDAEHISTRELEEAIRERDEAIKREKEALARENDTKHNLQMAESRLEDALREAREEATAARKQNEEFSALEKEYIDRITALENRPVEVAVQEPDPAEIERLVKEKTDAYKAEKDKALETFAEAQEKAKADAEKLRERLKAAEEKLAAAGAEDKAEAQALRGEVETLKKQLAMSSEKLAVFKLRFETWQEDYHRMQQALALVPEEQREKCDAAVKAVLAGWSA